MSLPKKIWSTDFTQLDEIKLKAAWLPKRIPATLAVKRFHDGHLRAHWEFEYAGRNQWECVRGTPGHMREEPVNANSKTRISDTSKIPHDIELKAREFLAQTLKLRPHRLRIGRQRKSQIDQL